MSLATETADTPHKRLIEGVVAPAQPNNFAEVPLGQITPDPSQPRKVFDAEFLQQLAETIRSKGVIQPIVVRPTPEAADGQTHICPYMIIAGESRWRASSIAGKTTIPAIVRRDLSDDDIVVMQVLENLQRRDLSLIETCEGIGRLVQQIGFDKTVAQTGKSKTWVSRHSTLAELPKEVLDLVKADKIDSVDVAKDLAQLVQLDKKAGAILVGRYAGTHSSYGSPIAQHALDAEELAELSEEERQEERDRQERLSRPPTRIEVREQLGQAKRTAEQKQKAAAAREEVKNDPQVVKAKESAKQQAEKTKADNLRREQFKTDLKKFEVDNTDALCAALGTKAPKRRDYGYDYNDPITVQSNDNLYPGCPVPANFNSLKFALRFRGVDAKTLQRISAAGFTAKVSVSLSLSLVVTPDLASKLEALLGAGQIKFATEIVSKASETPAFIERFNKAAAKGKDATAAATTKAGTSIEQFLAVGIVKKAGGRIKAGDLHAAYSAWCKKQKLDALPLNGANNAFGRAMRLAGVETIRSNGIQYTGIALA